MNVPLIDVSLSACRSSSKTMKSIAWILCLFFSITAFLLPALWNGFAIVFFDTGGYLDRVLTMSLYPGRSFLFGLFLWVTSFGWWSFWGPILIQSLLCLWLIHLMLRCHNLPAGPPATAVFCISLSLLTGISWYTSQLMPDILVPLVVLAIWLLGFHWHRLSLHERLGLLATALLGLMSHNSSLALGVGLIAVILMLRAAVYRKNWSISISILPPVAVVAASFVLIPMLNLALSGKATYASGGPVFLFARFVQEGIAQRWLADNCPVANIKLCKMQKHIPNTSEGFLWARNSPLRELGNWSGAAANAELGYVVAESLKDYPGRIFRSSLQATSQQFFMVETGDGLDNYQDYTRKVFSNLSPRISELFNKAGQQRNQMTQQLFNILNRVHVPVAYLSVLGLMMVIGWGLIAKRPDLAGLALFVFLALLGNAFICGALSGPFDRYQSRLIWLATLVVCMAIAGVFRGVHKHETAP
jgi:hypothetical protein